MKKVLAIAIVLLLAAGVVYAKDFELKKQAGEFNVTVNIDKNPPVAGDNNVTVAITDGAGKAVTDAKVILDYSMPPMPGMPPHNAHKTMTSTGGKYTAVMDLAMRGSWNVAVKVTRGGKTAVAKFSVDAQ